MKATIQRRWDHDRGGPAIDVQVETPTARYTAPLRIERSETELQREVVAWIDSLLDLRAFVFHVPNGGRRDRRTAAILRGMGVRAGVADLGMLREQGRSGWIELKTEEGTQEPEQLAFEARCIMLDHDYRVCRSVCDVHATMVEWGVHFIEPPLARAHREGR